MVLEICALICSIVAVIVAAINPWLNYRLQRKLELEIKEIERKMPYAQEEYKNFMEHLNNKLKKTD